MKNIQILIDASGSMGYMKGTKFEDQYLLPDKSTRTALVKKILINSIIPKLSFVEHIEISSFRNEVEKIMNENEIIETKQIPKYYNHYSNKFNLLLIENKIENLKDPRTGGTPLFWAFSMALGKNNIDEYNIIVLSDGDANDKENFDEEILKQIDVLKKKCKIYFIGIDQDEVAQKKSQNLANKTNGFYVNLEVMNYNEAIFNNMLFEFNTTITSNALKENLKIELKSVTIENKIETDIIEEVEESISNEDEVIPNLSEPNNLEKQVEENTKSLQLISSQLDQIVKQISFIGNNKLQDEDEFISNDDEELNKIIGNKTEKILFEHLKSKWPQTIWLNEIEEQGKPYDFEISQNQNKYFIECKGSVSNSLEFFLTKNEWSFYLENRNFYRLYFLNNINSETPEIIKIEDLLSSMEKGELIPCSNVNRKVKADRILFQIIR